MKKILMVAMAFLAVFAQSAKLQAAAGQQDCKRLADDQSDDVKKSKLNDDDLFSKKLLALISQEKDSDFKEFLFQDAYQILHDEESCKETFFELIDQRARKFYNHLSDAIFSKDCEEVERLVAPGGLNPNARIFVNSNGFLHDAVYSKNVEIIQLLIEAGADINFRGSGGLTPVFIAAGVSNDITKKLLAAGALVDIKGSSLLDECKIFGQYPEMSPIIRGKQLFEAIENNDEDSFKDSLVDEDGVSVSIDLNFEYLNGLTSLALAKKLNRVEMVRLIKQRQFFDAIIQNNMTAFNDLITAGADIQSRDLRGVRPLHAAAQVGNIQAVKALIAAGADIYATDRFGNTPFGVAAYEMNTILGNKNYVSLTGNYKQNYYVLHMDFVHQKNRTPEDEKRAETYQTILQMLIDAELMQAAKEHNPSAITELVIQGRKYLGTERIKPNNKAIKEALALATNPQSFIDDEDGESKHSVGYRRLNAQQKEERSKEVMRLLTESIQK